MTLKNARIGAVYTIDSLNLDRATMGRLEALGLTKGTDVHILNRNRSGSIILMVRGSRLAIGNKIADTIHMHESAKRKG